jgi:hypothetical protein
MKEAILAELIKKFGENSILRKKDIEEYVKSIGYDNAKFLYRKKFNVSWGKFQIPSYEKFCGKTNQEAVPINMMAQVIPIKNKNTESSQKFDPNAESSHDYAIIPDRDKHYVPFGEFKDIEQIIKSELFFPVFISGLSGNGKTFMVEQASARVKRKMIRIQLTKESDEDDLMGGFRLINGETKFIKGPVIRAMELGALLLLDEADRADAGKIMCLQGILEGKPYFVKKTGEVIYPKHGFNIMVTANTKGKGSDDGRYVSATMLDDAWLERFPITIEQNFPNAVIERKILSLYFSDSRDLTEDDNKFLDKLIMWAEVIRKTFIENAIDEVISTRRLVHIIRTYTMFGDRMRSIRLCINRFDEETKTAFLDLYTKVDETVSPLPSVPTDSSIESVVQETVSGIVPAP